MIVFDSYTREQLRQTYANAWRKHLAHTPLTPLEAMIADVIGGASRISSSGGRQGRCSGGGT